MSLFSRSPVAFEIFFMDVTIFRDRMVTIWPAGGGEVLGGGILNLILFQQPLQVGGPRL